VGEGELSLFCCLEEMGDRPQLNTLAFTSRSSYLFLRSRIECVCLSAVAFQFIEAKLYFIALRIWEGNSLDVGPRRWGVRSRYAIPEVSKLGHGAFLFRCFYRLLHFIHVWLKASLLGHWISAFAQEILTSCSSNWSIQVCLYARGAQYSSEWTWLALDGSQYRVS
jgi:hypothetical protein